MIDAIELPLFDAAKARKRRDEGIAKVTDHNQPWAMRALDLIAIIRHEFSDFTGEQLRVHVQAVIGAPDHPNAWGAICVAAIRHGLIVATGEYRQMNTPGSHARKTPVYRSAE